jgi:hypothetical protein
MRLPSADFESAASASSAIPAHLKFTLSVSIKRTMDYFTRLVGRKSAKSSAQAVALLATRRRLSTAIQSQNVLPASKPSSSLSPVPRPSRRDAHSSQTAHPRSASLLHREPCTPLLALNLTSTPETPKPCSHGKQCLKQLNRNRIGRCPTSESPNSAKNLRPYPLHVDLRKGCVVGLLCCPRPTLPGVRQPCPHAGDEVPESDYQ